MPGLNEHFAELQVQRLSRRTFVGLSAGLLASALLAACGDDDDDDDDASPTEVEAGAEPTATAAEGGTEPTATTEEGDAEPTEEGDAEPTATTPEPEATPTGDSGAEVTRGGTLIYASNLDADTLDPHFSTQFSERYALYLMFNTLVGYDPDFNIVPELAEAWDLNEDGTAITFHLREGVTFHDGTDCDAEAVKWNIERVLDPEVNSPLRSQLEEAVDTVEAVDSVTLRLNLLKPWRPILASLGERPGFIISPTAAEELGEDFARNPVGSGPFRFVEWVPDSHVAMERFEDYWDEGKPYLDRIEIRHVPEGQVQLTQVRTGEAHLIDAIDPTLLPTVQDAEDVVIEELESGRFHGVQKDVDKPPFDNEDLRLALDYATDREQIKEVMFGGTGRVATHPLGAGWAYDPSLDDEAYTFDLDLAREHLEASGMAGETLTLSASNTQFNQTLAQLLQAQYQELGITVEIDTVNAADLFTLVKEDEKNWVPTSWAPRADPDGLLRILWHTNGFQNTTGFSDPEVDRLLDEAASLYDTEAAAEIYHEVERIIAKTADYTFTHWPSVFAVRRVELENFVYHPDLIIRMREFYLRSG
jgi:peptide/nickel transport system substrate-binding protein